MYACFHILYISCTFFPEWTMYSSQQIHCCMSDLMFPAGWCGNKGSWEHQQQTCNFYGVSSLLSPPATAPTMTSIVFRLDNYMNAQDPKVVLLVYTYEIASKKEYEIWCHGFHDGLYSMIKCLLVININSSPWHQRTVRWTPHGAAAAAAWRPSVGAFASIWSHLHPHPAANDCFLLSFRLNAAERQEIHRSGLTQHYILLR